jgi:hypothetical protein
MIAGKVPEFVWNGFDTFNNYLKVILPSLLQFKLSTNSSYSLTKSSYSPNQTIQDCFPKNNLGV